MYLNEETGELVGKVEIPEKGWFHDHFMKILLGEKLAQDLGILQGNEKKRKYPEVKKLEVKHE